MIQNLPTKSAVVEGFSLASQHADIKFLISPRLVGMTDSFVFWKELRLIPKLVILNSEGRA
ncbi:phosphogluconate dehydratase [Vibrio alginolyticus 12G01]|nr:phosphogluconate dehydratase [Vibrio alginolyticus 12G01]